MGIGAKLEKLRTAGFAGLLTALIGLAPLFLVPQAEAADPDPMTIKAMQYMDRIEAAVAKIAPGDQAKLKSQQDILKKWGPRLEGIRDKGPKWDEAVARFNAMMAAITAKAAAEPEAPAAEAPASTAAPAAGVDPVVADALTTMDEIQAAVATIAPGDKTNLKPQYDALKALEPRLKGVSDKNATWKEAAQRYNALHNEIVDKAKAAPAAAAQTGSAAGPADPIVVQAQKDLDRYEALSEAMAAGDTAKGQLYVNEMDAKIQTPLMTVADKTHEAWRAAAQRYTDLQGKIVAKANATAAAPAAGDADPETLEALALIADYEAKAEAMAPGDQTAGRAYLTELGPVGTLLKSAKNKAHPQWNDARKRYNALNNRIVEIAEKDPNVLDVTGLISSDQAKIKRINRNVLGAYETIDKAHFQTLLDGDQLGALLDRLDGFRQDLARFPDASQPAVAAVAGRIEAAAALLQQRTAEAQAKGEEIGDVDAQIAEIDRHAQETKIPYPQGFDPAEGAEAAKAYVEQLQAYRAQSVVDMAVLDKLEAAGVRNQKTSSLRHWAGGYLLREIDENLARSQERIDFAVQPALDTAAWHMTTDPTDVNHQANRLLGEGQYEETVANLEAGFALIDTGAAFDQALGRTDGPDRAAQRAALQEGLNRYKSDFQTALGFARMPEAAETDDKYIEIAEGILANPNYDSINPYKRIVVNSKFRHREKETGDISSGTVSTTITVYKYSWDEFQFATAEKVGDKYFIFYNTAKYFYSGADTTPLDRWLMAGRHKSIQILEENIDK